MAKKKAVKKKTTRKKSAKKKVAVKKVAVKTIEKDFQACEELLRKGTGRNEWIEENCKRMKSWQEAAEAGDARGQVLYGLCFYYGSGVKENEKTAAKWFTKSAEQGNAQGQFSLGQCYFFGKGGEEDEEKAVKWFTKSAEQGNAQGQFSLGQCYRGGHGVEEDLTKAVECYTRSAKQGHEDALQSLGKAWLRSPESISKSDVTFLRKRSSNGCQSALKILGCLCLLGDCLPQNVKKGEELIRKGNGVLTRDVAVEFLLDEDSIDLESFVLLEADAAEVFARVGDALKLNGLVRISTEIADSLSTSDRWLELDGLTDVDDDTAKSLANCSYLSLDGLRTLTPEAAGYFLEAGYHSVVEGLPSITPNVATLLVDSVDTLALSLPRLSSIDKVTAESLLGGPESLHLDGIKSLTPNIAGVLATGRFELSLNGLETVSTAVAETLVNSPVQTLELNGLTKLSEKVAQILSGFDGSLSLNSLRDIDVKTATALTSESMLEELSLTGLNSVPEKVLIVFGTFRGRLVLSDILQDQVKKRRSSSTKKKAAEKRPASSRLSCHEPTVTELKALSSGVFRYIKLLDVAKKHASLLSEIGRHTRLEELTITNDGGLELPGNLVSSLGMLKSLRSLSLHVSGLSDDAIRAISGLPELMHFVCKTWGSDCDVSPILEMASLKTVSIDLSRSQGTSSAGIFSGFTNEHRLVDLTIRGIPFRDEEMEPFTQLTGLSSLYFWNIKDLKGGGFKFLGRSVKELSLYNCKDLDDSAIINAATNCRLKNIWIEDCPHLTDASLDVLLELKSLKFIELDIRKGRKGRISQAAINRLKRKKIEVRVWD